MDVQFNSKHGKPTSKFSTYQNIDSLVSDSQKTNYAAIDYKIPNQAKAQRPSTAHHFEKRTVGEVQVADPESLIKSLQDIKSRSYATKHSEMEQEQELKSMKAALEQNAADARLQGLIGQALTQKEGLISELEAELNAEKARRSEMHSQFTAQMQEFKKDQEALAAIQEANRKMQANKSERSKTAKAVDKGELDQVPTKQSAKKEWNGRVQSSIPKSSWEPRRKP